MLEQKDIYKAAKVFMDEHGENALTEALKKEFTFIEAGNWEEATVWHCIGGAIKWAQMSSKIKADQI